MPAEISTAIAVISVVIAIVTAATSARKTRVDNLVAIIDAQAKHIANLEAQVSDLQTQLDVATKRITELEALNQRYRRMLIANCINPDPVPDGP